MTNPKNYRHYNGPYGYRVKDGQLVLNAKELKICRLIVELIGRQNFGFRETAEELCNRGFKNRRGDVSWGHFVVNRIYQRWKDRL